MFNKGDCVKRKDGGNFLLGGGVGVVVSLLNNGTAAYIGDMNSSGRLIDFVGISLLELIPSPKLEDFI